MTEAGADIVVCHLGPDDRRRDRRRDRADARRLRAADRRAGPPRPRRCASDVIVLCHGGPIATPDDARLHPRATARVPRLLRRELDGAAADRDGAHRDDAALHPDSTDQGDSTMTGAQFGSFILGLIVVAIVVAIVGLAAPLALPAQLEGARVRAHRARRPEGRARRRRLRAADRARRDPGQHEHAAPRGHARPRQGADHADRMRVDVIAEFYVRVAARAEAVAAAAQTLGQRTMEPEQLKELVEGKFVDALRTAAAEMTMEELHEKRGAYVKRVRETVAEDLTQERPRARVGLADPARPDRHGVLQPEQRLRRRGPDAPDRADRAAQEAAQRRRAGHADRDPQQEPRGREALARDRPRGRVRAPDAAARGRDRARRASAPS